MTVSRLPSAVDRSANHGERPTVNGERPTAHGQRLLALDVFRGMTVAAMLLVNDPGTWSAIYWPLDHAEWHGWTPTDLIFPFFLFIVGITTHLARKEPKKILRRGALIILFGLLLNAFPFFWWGKIAGVAEPTLLQRIAYRFEHLRFMGVLQRIGIVYIIAALIALYTSRRQRIAIVVVILLGYWAILSLGPLAPPDATIAARTDRAILGTNHIWAQSKTWDPEGPLSTLPAIATALLGILIAEIVGSGQWAVGRENPTRSSDRDPLPTANRQLPTLFALGAAGLALGWLWGLVFPINKNLWTSSYVVFTAGFACVMLAACIWLIDIRGIRAWSKPFAIFGLNPLVAFVGSGLMARLIGSLIKVEYGGKRIPLQAASYRATFEPYFEPHFASLLWGLAFVLFWLVVLAILARTKTVLRV
ncbi:MAG TPA: heparan-alpha-glucosaminide N-acetyltransferase domain-containing protein [Thermoanaerobaculia bacterium]|nr:heparan-alpha-glucosaminide N-acetyltransferase domain-containing protein [Thermoanaerobaculia bacterium]